MSVCYLSLLTAAVAIARGGSAAYCDDNLFRVRDDEPRKQLRSPDQVRFTKELSTNEYGPLASFKTLHCCGEKYLSLEWFKDNRPYPWPSDVSSFILNPESANQTIYTRSLTPSDHGMYTCQLASQKNIVNHSIQLVTFDVKSYWGDPLPTYEMPLIHYAQPGDSVRLYCEGFVGQVGLPDAVNTITWKKINGNQTFESSEKYKIKEVIREHTQVLGAFLFIYKLEEIDYGQYVCSISNTDDQIVQQFTNITKPVFYNEQPHNTGHRDLKLISTVMLALILIVWKRRWFYLVYQKLKKKFENNKYALSEKTVPSVIVFYDEENKESAKYLLEKIDFHDNFIIKKYHTKFDGEFVKEHTDLVNDYDFVIYVLSSITSSLMMKSLSLIQDNESPKKYIIDCGNMPVSPLKLCCDRVLADLNSEHLKRNHLNMQKELIRII